jgi:cytochrome P450
LAQDGKDWEHSRAMMRPQFTRDQVNDLDLEERHVQNLMRTLPTNSEGWTDEVDLQVLFFRLTIDSACEFLFGKSIDSQLTALNPSHENSPKFGPDEKKFAWAFDMGQMLLATRARFQTLYPIYQPPVFHQCCKDCHEFIDHFVRIALIKTTAKKSRRKDEGIKGNTSS